MSIFCKSVVIWIHKIIDLDSIHLYFLTGNAQDDSKPQKKELSDLEDLAFQLLPCFVLLKLHDRGGVATFGEQGVLSARELSRGMQITAGMRT